MTTITLKRTSEFTNIIRNYKIFIDGQQVGTIANGQTKNFPTTVGKHIITAKIDWCSSPEILVDVKDNQTKNLKVGCFRNGQFLTPIVGGLFALHFILSKFADFEHTLFLIGTLFLLYFLLLVYYWTIGRKKYLTLDEINDNI